MSEQTMTIREMCDLFGVTPRTLRFYESKELIHPLRDGQKRLFTRRDRARMTLILRGRRFGFSLEDMRQLLDLYGSDDHGATQLGRTIAVARARLVDMEQQRDALDESIADLQGQIGQAELRLEELVKSAA